MGNMGNIASYRILAVWLVDSAYLWAKGFTHQLKAAWIVCPVERSCRKSSSADRWYNDLENVRVD